MYVFISHSSNNADIASYICSMIENNGHRCFIAPRDIRSGYEYAEEIINGIDNSDVMLLLLSQDANDSPHVLREIERAVSKKIPVIVYKMEEVQLSRSMEYFLMTHQWVSAKPNNDHSEMLRCINEMAAGRKHEPSNGKVLSKKEAKKAEKKKSKAPLIVAIISFSLVAIIAIVCMAATMIFGTFIDKIGPKIFADETIESSEEAFPIDVQTISEVKEHLLGETIAFGTYNQTPINWRIIDISDDGTTATMIADNILTMKCYDAAEGGKYNYFDGEYYWSTPSAELDDDLARTLRGDNNWENSNIRTWLNSDKENVTYTGQEPNAQAMSEMKNGYNTEAGFLNGFTDEELDDIIPVTVTTNGVETKDRVYLLSSDELALLEAADVSKYAVPTTKARELDLSRWYELHMSDYGVDDHYWWLRDAGDAACDVNVVTFSYAGGNVIGQPAGLEGYGVRPVINVKLTSENVMLNYIMQEIYNEITKS